MAVEWTDLESYALDMASAIEKDEANECAYRNASSRLYYTAFHCAKDLAESVPGLPAQDEGSVHQALIKRFLNYPALQIVNTSADFYKAVKKLGYQLNGLRGKRVEADYDIVDRFNKNDFKQCLEDFKRYRSQVDSIRNMMNEFSTRAAESHD